MFWVWVKRKTPSPFIAACEKFKYLEVLAQTAINPENNNKGYAEKNGKLNPSMTSLTEIISTIKNNNY